MATYSPSMQVKFGSYPARCIMGKAPTLAKVKKEYGEQVALDWLRIEINDYQHYVAVKDEAVIEADVATEMAAFILADWYWLKLSEVMLFFRWLKTGKYGELYGRINPQSFFVKLRSFVKDRNDIIFHEESEQRRKADEESRKNAISQEEWGMLKAKKLEHKK